MPPIRGIDAIPVPILIAVPWWLTRETLHALKL